MNWKCGMRNKYKQWGKVVGTHGDSAELVEVARRKDY